MPDTIYRCLDHGTNLAHRHSREVGQTDWTGPHVRTSGAPTSDTPVPEGRERHCAPDGTPYVFNRYGWTVDAQPETDNPRLWPVEECLVRNHGNLSGVHYHVATDDGRVLWHGRPDAPGRGQTLAQGHRFVARDFAERNRITFTTPTTTEESTDMTIRPGTVVTSTARPARTNLDHQFVVVCRNPTIEGHWVIAATADRGGEPGWGWTSRSNTSYLAGLTPETLAYLADHHVTLWTVDEDALTPVRGLVLNLDAGLLALRNHLISVPSLGTDEVTEEVNLRPLTLERARRHPSLMLHSRLGEHVGNTIRFGCQTFEMSAVAAAHGTMQFTPQGVRVTVPATVRGDSVWIVDRTLSFGNVNEWTERIIATTPVAIANGVVMEHGYYGCAEHEREVLHLFRDEGSGASRLAKIHPDDGSRALSGIVGLTTGLADVNFRECKPVKGSTTARIMRTESSVRYSLVPTREGAQREWLAAQREYVMAALPATATATITACDQHGTVS